MGKVKNSTRERAADVGDILRDRRRLPGAHEGGRESTSIGMRIRTLRQEAGWTQAELGAPEYSKAYVSQIESGKVTPSLATLSVLASKLGTSLEALLPVGDAEHRAQDLERLWRAADRLSDHGEDATSVDLLEQAARLSTASQDARLRGEGHLRYATALWRVGNVRHALDECEEAIEAFSGSNDPTLLGRAYNAAGIIYRDLSEWAAARRYFQRALRMFPRRSVWHSRVLINLTTLLARAREYKEAHDYCRRAIDITHSYGDGELEGLSRIAFSYTLIEIGEPAQALKEIAAAEKLFAASGKPQHMNLCRHNRIIAEHRMGVPNSAKGLRQWLQEVEEAGAHEIAVALYEELVQSALKDGDLQAAVDLSGQGLEQAVKARDRFCEASLLRLLALARLRQGNVSDAIPSLLQARELYADLRLRRVYEDGIPEFQKFLPDGEGPMRLILETPLRGS